MKNPLYIVDAFTSRAFRGNPAGVCLLEGELDPITMQNLAMELRLSQTAFIKRLSDDQFHIRWFSPEVEVAVCAHATLAGAHILYETGWVDSKNQIEFHSLAGALQAKHKGKGVELNFPTLNVYPVKYPELEKALGVQATFVGQTGLKFCVAIESFEELVALKPKREALIGLGIRAVSVTCPGHLSEFDFCSRYFAPIVGIDEDPVCGSSHTFLAPYWAQILGKNKLRAYQASSRGGELDLEVVGPRVLLTGEATTVIEGNFKI